MGAARCIGKGATQRGGNVPQRWIQRLAWVRWHGEPKRDHTEVWVHPHQLTPRQLFFRRAFRNQRIVPGTYMHKHIHMHMQYTYTYIRP